MEEFRKLINSFVDEFSELGYEKPPLPTIVRSTREAYEHLGEIPENEDIEKGDYLCGFYVPDYDRVFLIFRTGRAAAKDLKILVFHELLHQWQHRTLLKAGYDFSTRRIRVSRGPDRARLLFARLLNQVIEHYFDCLVDRTLMREHGLVRSKILGLSEGKMNRILERWKMGPLEGTTDISLSGVDFRTALWLTYGLEFFVHVENWPELVKKEKDALESVAPWYRAELKTVLDGLTVSTKPGATVSRFLDTARLVGLDIRLHELGGKKSPLFLDFARKRINNVLKRFR